jgi:hypothetical protein
MKPTEFREPNSELIDQFPFVVNWVFDSDAVDPPAILLGRDADVDPIGTDIPNDSRPAVIWGDDEGVPPCATLGTIAIGDDSEAPSILGPRLLQ